MEERPAATSLALPQPLPCPPKQSQQGQATTAAGKGEMWEKVLHPRGGAGKPVAGTGHFSQQPDPTRL